LKRARHQARVICLGHKFVSTLLHVSLFSPLHPFPVSQPGNSSSEGRWWRYRRADERSGCEHLPALYAGRVVPDILGIDKIMSALLTRLIRAGAGVMCVGMRAFVHTHARSRTRDPVECPTHARIHRMSGNIDLWNLKVLRTFPLCHVCDLIKMGGEETRESREIIKWANWYLSNLANKYRVCFPWTFI